MRQLSGYQEDGERGGWGGAGGAGTAQFLHQRRGPSGLRETATVETNYDAKLPTPGAHACLMCLDPEEMDIESAACG